MGISPRAIRDHIASGRLPATKRGRSWWLDERTVERMARHEPARGRPLSPSMAWAVLLLASGEKEAAESLARRERYPSRMRAWLAKHPLNEYALQLRSRATLEELDAHPSELKRILDRSDVLATGSSASTIIGLVGQSTHIEAYAPASHRKTILSDHALTPTTGGAARIRWVPDELWSQLPRDAQRRAPRAAILLDLLESDDPRSRREAARALAR